MIASSLPQGDELVALFIRKGADVNVKSKASNKVSQSLRN